MRNRGPRPLILTVGIVLALILLSADLFSMASIGTTSGTASAGGPGPLPQGTASLGGKGAIPAAGFFVSPLSGNRFQAFKDSTSGIATWCSPGSGECFTSRAEILRAEAQSLPRPEGVIAPDLRARLAVPTAAQERVNVIVQFDHGTFSTVATTAWRSRADEMSRLIGVAGGDVSSVRAPADADLWIDDARRGIYVDAGERMASSREETERLIEAVGGTVTGHTPVLGAVYAALPVSSLPVLAQHPEVKRIYANGRMTAALNVSPGAIFADVWWAAGYSGGTWDLAVVDTGIDPTHPALTPDVAQVFHAAAQTDPCYDDNAGNPDDLHGHGTHIAGIVSSTDPVYRGVAHGMDALINAKAGYLGCDGSSWMWWSDAMDAIDWAIASAGADVISFSFGGAPGSGDTPMAQYFDAVVDTLGVTAAIAAHNFGPDAGTITDPGTAYNVLTVASINDMNTILRGDDVLSSFSGRGPTGDGRLKPDIAAPGAEIASANAFWETEDDYVSWSGTSMATPHVAASAILLLDGRGAAVFPPILKALLLNHADDLGPAGADTGYGWGYMNLSRTFAGRSNVYEGTVAAGPTGYRFYVGPTLQGDRATLVWNRHAVHEGSEYPGIVYPLNDLDLFAYSEADGSRLAASVRNADNVEQVVSPSSVSSMVYKVRVQGAVSGVVEERYAIALPPNTSEVAPPAFSVSLSPEAAELGSPFTVTADVLNTGGLAAMDVEVTLNLPPGLTLVSGPNPQALGRIAAASSRSASWQVVGTVHGLKQPTLVVSSPTYEEAFEAESGPQEIMIHDTIRPESAADPLAEYTTVTAFSVTASADDLGGVSKVDLFYRKGAGPWTLYESDLATPWEWLFDTTGTGGDGRYEFHTIATDAASNVESPPDLADTNTSVDTLPPESSAVFAGTLGWGGRYASAVTVTLQVREDGSGTASTEYRVDGGPWTTYVSPFVVEGDGTHTIAFRSLDRLGHLEAIRTATFIIDTNLLSLTGPIGLGGILSLVVGIAITAVAIFLLVRRRRRDREPPPRPRPDP